MARVAIFVEDRVVRDSSGHVLTTNRRLGGEEWRRLGPRGDEAVLCVRLTHLDTLDAGHRVGGEVVRLPYFQGIGQAAWRMPELLYRSLRIARGVDLVVVKLPGLVGTAGIVAAKLSRTPLAVHFVGDPEESVSDSVSLRARLLKASAKRISQWAVRQADAVRYPTRTFLQEKYPAAHPTREYWYTDASVIVVGEVPDTTSFIRGRIVAIGSQERMYKGHDVLIKALATVREQVPGAHLVLVGNGACRRDLESLVDEMGLGDLVDFVDFLDGWAAVSEMIESAHVFAMPSMVEGLPRALLEAMSLGAPCVGSDVSGIPELLPPELLVPRGAVAPLAEILIRIMEDDDLRQAVARTCLERCTPFTASAMDENIEGWRGTLSEMTRRT